MVLAFVYMYLKRSRLAYWKCPSTGPCFRPPCRSSLATGRADDVCMPNIRFPLSQSFLTLRKKKKKKRGSELVACPRDTTEFRDRGLIWFEKKRFIFAWAGQFFWLYRFFFLEAVFYTWIGGQKGRVWLLFQNLSFLLVPSKIEIELEIWYNCYFQFKADFSWVFTRYVH